MHVIKGTRGVRVTNNTVHRTIEDYINTQLSPKKYNQSRHLLILTHTHTHSNFAKCGCNILAENHFLKSTVCLVLG